MRVLSRRCFVLLSDAHCSHSLALLCPTPCCLPWSVLPLHFPESPPPLLLRMKQRLKMSIRVAHDMATFMQTSPCFGAGTMAAVYSTLLLSLSPLCSFSVGVFVPQLRVASGQPKNNTLFLRLLVRTVPLPIPLFLPLHPLVFLL